MEVDHSQPLLDVALGFPELTELGKRIEMLRIERGISKQRLARHAGTSRQQLWRVMTGKSEMSPALRARLGDALNVASLHVGAVASTHRTAAAVVASTTAVAEATPAVAADLAAYLASASHIARTLASLPVGDSGRALKRRLLDAIEDAAIDAGVELDHAVFELRRKVLSGQL
ncbi:MAG TPA: helix-turn-helix transcriptional regulator [Gemmatimonadaceae bacterium]|jgi:transcriptional regulator with XRE-family HTH domain